MIGATSNYIINNLPNEISFTSIITGLLLGIIVISISCYFNRTKKERF